MRPPKKRTTRAAPPVARRARNGDARMAASSASADVEVCSAVRGDGDAPAVDRACEHDAAAAAEAEAEAKRREEARRAAEAHEARVVMAEAQLNRIWKSTGLKIERIVANATADSGAGDAASTSKAP